MKWTNITTTLVVFLLLGVACPPKAGAQTYLLIVNDANPAAVTFTATSNNPSASDATHPFNDGIELIGFFSKAPSSNTFLTDIQTTLTTSVDKTTFYDYVQPDNLVNTSTFEDLAINNPVANTEHFTTTSAAFLGSATFDLTVFGALPSAGTTGVIYTGSTNDISFPGQPAPVPIGYYMVVPEASSAWLLLVGGQCYW